MNTVFETVNSFVAAFLIESGASEEIIKKWQENEEQFKGVVESVVPEKAKKEKKAKKPKDAPKNPKSAYIFFCQENRPDVKENHPDLAPKEILKELGGLWQNTSDTTRAKFQKLADEDKKRYEEEMKNYVPKPVDEQEEKEKTKRAKKPKDAPKGAKSGYMFFCADKRPEVKMANPEFGPKEILKELGQLWQNTHADDRESYEELAKQDKLRYKEEMENYIPNANVVEEEKEKKPRKPRAKKPAGSPKNAKTAYMFYCADKRSEVKEENPEMKGKELLTELARRWKEVKDTAAIRKYERMAKMDKDRYNEEMEKFKHAQPENTEDDDDDDDEVIKPVKTLAEEITDIIENIEGNVVTKRKIKDELAKRNIEFTKDEFENALVQAQE
jgi:hypothetical protein